MDSIRDATRSVIAGIMSYSMLIQNISLSTKNILIATFTAVLISCLMVASSKKRQRLAPNIPVVGGSDKKSILKNRRRFIHDGMSMLAEGYEQVSGHDQC